MAAAVISEMMRVRMVSSSGCGGVPVRKDSRFPFLAASAEGVYLAWLGHMGQSGQVIRRVSARMVSSGSQVVCAAWAASSARVVMPSLAKMWDKCTLTVAGGDEQPPGDGLV